jgi:hypothetical protein
MMVEITVEMMDELKRQRDVKREEMTRKINQLLENLKELEDKEVFYINGEAEDLREFCIKEKQKIKIKGIEDDEEKQ